MNNFDFSDNKLIQSLLKSEAYPHPVKDISVVETHISWVICTGLYAYKIKKALNLGFINSETLDKRNFLCHEEIRLNRRLAPELYLGIVDVIGPIDKAKISTGSSNLRKISQNTIIEYAIKMKQFDSNNLLTNKVYTGGINEYSVKSLAKRIAFFHLSQPKSSKSKYIDITKSIKNPVLENIKSLSFSNLPQYKDFLESQAEWVEKQWLKLYPSFKARIENSVFRECHGDLHLGNIYMKQNDRLEVFDSIDFNENLRWIDPLSEIAFLVMDLSIHNQHRNANIFLNEWLHQTGDYWGLDLLPWYTSYRALVRAKVLGIQLNQASSIQTDKSETYNLELLKSYIKVVEGIDSGINKGLILMNGVSGSGKSYLSEKLCFEFNAIWIRSDIERQRVVGEIPFRNELNYSSSSFDQRKQTPLFKGNKYDPVLSKWLYKSWLADILKYALESGHIVIVDATFLKRADRDLMVQVASIQGVKSAIIACECTEQTAKSRLLSRQQLGHDPSEADTNIRSIQSELIQPLTEKEALVSINFNESTNIEEVVEKTKRLLDL